MSNIICYDLLYQLLKFENDKLQCSIKTLKTTKQFYIVDVSLFTGFLTYTRVKFFVYFYNFMNSGIFCKKTSSPIIFLPFSLKKQISELGPNGRANIVDNYNFNILFPRNLTYYTGTTEWHNHSRLIAKQRHRNYKKRNKRIQT